MKVIAETLEVSRSNLYEDKTKHENEKRHYRKAGDA